MVIRNNENVHFIELKDKEIILVGTAHVSSRSVDEVKQVIERERPDTVCIELCEARYRNLTDNERWKSSNITKIIKDGKAMLLLVNLILSSYQKRLAEQFNIKPGQEMMQGMTSAQEVGAELCLADRDLQTTMMRLWRNIGLWGKLKLFFQLLLSMFMDEEMSEEELERMKSSDMLSVALEDLSVSFPDIKSNLIDERDQYLAQKIKEAPGHKVVAVLGAGHIPGVKQELLVDHDLEALSQIPPPSPWSKGIGWGIPILILLLIASTFSVDRGAGMDQMAAWIIWNGVLAALGALLAFAHPLSILTALVASPITSLNPLLAAGWFAGLTEAMIKKPLVQDFENMAQDINSIKGFWNNKVTHILLVVALSNIGSSLGAMFGGIEVIRHFINTFVS